MNKRSGLTLAVAVLLAGVLAACGGGAPAPVTLGQLPVFAGATETTHEIILNSLKTQLETVKTNPQIANADGNVYDLPADTTWDAVNSFYKGELEKAGWKVAQSGENLLALSRGKQAFVLSMAPGPVLVVVLTDEK